MKGRSRLRLMAATVVVWMAIIGLAQPGLAQSAQTRQVMRQKLQHSEALLAALVTSNWNQLERHGRAIQQLTMQPGWDVLRLPEFASYTSAFQRSTAALIEAASAHDASAALGAYNGLVSSCVECHRYVARSRLAAR